MLRWGLGLLILATALFLFALRMGNAHDREPVNVPLSFAQKGQASRSFTADSNATYLVEMDLHRDLPFDRLQAVIGGLNQQSPVLNVRPERVPAITYSVTDSGQEVMRKYEGWYFSDTCGAEVGKFKGIAGRQYVVRARVTQPLARLQVLRPHLRVSVSPAASEGTIVRTSILLVLSLLTFVIGAICSAVGVVRARKLRKAWKGT